jgi:hypothetical protein
MHPAQNRLITYGATSFWNSCVVQMYIMVCTRSIRIPAQFMLLNFSAVSWYRIVNITWVLLTISSPRQISTPLQGSFERKIINEMYVYNSMRHWRPTFLFLVKQHFLRCGTSRITNFKPDCSLNMTCFQRLASGNNVSDAGASCELKWPYKVQFQCQVMTRHLSSQNRNLAPNSSYTSLIYLFSLGTKYTKWTHNGTAFFIYPHVSCK